MADAKAPTRTPETTAGTAPNGTVTQTGGNVKQHQLRYKNDSGYAPTFYSQMSRTIDGIKQTKLGASSVVSYLRGRGVKAEEIKWSGIEEWLQSGKNAYKFSVNIFTPMSMFTSMAHALSGMEATVEAHRKAANAAERDIAELEKIIASPFAKAEELAKKQVRYNELMEILNPKDEQNLDDLDDEEDDTAQYQEKSSIDADSDADVQYSLKDDHTYDNEQTSHKKKRTYPNWDETYYMRWAHGSTPVGSLLKTRRYDHKIHFYEKTEDGQVEITKEEFAYKRGGMFLKLSTEQKEKLAILLIKMGLEDEELLTVVVALETVEEMHTFLSKLSARSYKMTPEEVYEAAGETVSEHLPL